MENEDATVEPGLRGMGSEDMSAPASTGGGTRAGSGGVERMGGGLRYDDADVDPCSVFLGGLPFDSDEGAIRKVFEEFGEVVKSKILMDYKTGAPKGCGFVQFTSPKAASLAIKEMDGQIVDGRQIRVSLMRRKPDAGWGRHPGGDPGHAGGRQWERSGRGGVDRDGPGPGPPSHRDGPESAPERQGLSGPGRRTASPSRYHCSPQRPGYSEQGMSPEADPRHAGEAPVDRGYRRHRGSMERGERRRGEGVEYEEEEYGGEYEGRGGGEWGKRGRKRQSLETDPRDSRSGKAQPGRAGPGAHPGGTSGRGLVDADGVPQREGPSAALLELRKSVEEARAERDELSKKIETLEESLGNSTSNESFLKDRIKALESIKMQASAQLEHRTALHAKLVVALAKVQDAQERVKESEKELKALLVPLLPSIQSKLDADDAGVKAGVLAALGAPSAPSACFEGALFPITGAPSARPAPSDSAAELDGPNAAG